MFRKAMKEPGLFLRSAAFTSLKIRFPVSLPQFPARKERGSAALQAVAPQGSVQETQRPCLGTDGGKGRKDAEGYKCLQVFCCPALRRGSSTSSAPGGWLL